MKKLLFGLSMAIALGTTGAYAADIIQINPDDGGGDPVLNVGSLGWNNGNAIAIGTGSAAGLLAACGTYTPTGATSGDCSNQNPFQTYAQGTLSNFNNSLGNPIGGTQLNSSYEWSYVTGFQEVVTHIDAATPNGVANFQTVGGGNNFFTIYYDPSMNADPLTGQGFTNGTAILSGMVLPFDASTGLGASNFTTTGLGGALDQYITDNYVGTTSVSGNGSTHLLVDLTCPGCFADTNFFLNGLSLLDINFDTFQNDPFTQQNPSSCFYDGSGSVNGAGPITAGTATPAQIAAACLASSVGSVNGVDGPNFMFETRGTSAFTRSIPEPETLALFGLGLTGLGLARRRKRLKI